MINAMLNFLLMLGNAYSDTITDTSSSSVTGTASSSMSGSESASMSGSVSGIANLTYDANVAGITTGVFVGGILVVSCAVCLYQERKLRQSIAF